MPNDFQMPLRHSLPIALTLVLIHILSPAATKSESPFDAIASLVDESIARGELPGAVVVLADRKTIRYQQAFGDRQVEPAPIPMTTDAVFDLASITKPVATATSICLLAQQGKLSPNDVVSKYLPAFKGDSKETITIEQCLLHTSGLIPDNSLADYQQGPDEAWRKICALKLRSAPGEKFSYSDVGFIVLGKLISRVSGQTLDEFSRDNLFLPMGMRETGYLPAPELHKRAVPTEKHDGRWLTGQVHDPRARELGGIAGHAGLFSTASDLVRFGRNLISALHEESQCLDAESVRQMTASRAVPRGTRTLGWDHRSPYSRNRGDSLSDAAFGHGGFTGTVLWIDPEKELIFVFLSSRLHPDGKGSINTLAGKIASLAGQNW